MNKNDFQNKNSNQAGAASSQTAASGNQTGHTNNQTGNTKSQFGQQRQGFRNHEQNPHREGNQSRPFQRDNSQRENSQRENSQRDNSQRDNSYRQNSQGQSQPYRQKIFNRVKVEETVEDIKADIIRVEKEIELEIKEIKSMKLGM